MYYKKQWTEHSKEKMADTYINSFDPSKLDHFPLFLLLQVSFRQFLSQFLGRQSFFIFGKKVLCWLWVIPYQWCHVSRMTQLQITINALKGKASSKNFKTWSSSRESISGFWKFLAFVMASHSEWFRVDASRAQCHYAVLGNEATARSLRWLECYPPA